MMGSITKHTMHVAPSTLEGRTREKASFEFNSLLSARPISPKIGLHIGFT
jgi:hypothetical protein